MSGSLEMTALKVIMSILYWLYFWVNGKTKAFVRSHTSWVESFRCNQVDLGMTEHEHVLIPGSFVNSTFLYGALSTLFLGGTVYVLTKFSPARLMDVLKSYPITHCLCSTDDDGGLNKGRLFMGIMITFISTGAKWLPRTKGENASAVSKR